MSAYPNTKSHNSGFSLVEIMVGIAIGLLGVLVIMQVSVIFEAKKRTTTTGNDAQTTGAVALYVVQQDVRVAGYGFNIPDALGCNVKRSFEGAASSSPLRPIVIVNAASGAPDSITILSSSKSGWSLPLKVTTDHAQADVKFFVNSTLDMKTGDMLIAYEAGKDCALMQISALPAGSNGEVDHQGGSWNQSNVFPATGYSSSANLFNLGSMVERTYFRDAAGNLVLRIYSYATNSTVDQVLASDIVNFQIQYGFDTRPGTQSDIRVDAWKDDMFDADGNGTAGDNGDLRRIGAVRMALVTRSALKERVNAATGSCDTTSTAPQWSAAGVTLDVSKNPDGTNNADWKCYRYKVFESVTPLRNLIWGNV